MGVVSTLTMANVTRWSRVMCPVRRFDFMTSNAAEVWNSRLRWARRLPVCTVLETCRTIIEKWFYERRTAAASNEHVLTNKAKTKLEGILESSRTMNVQPLDFGKFKVADVKKNFVVSLTDRTCTCGQFDFYLMPCSHAAAALRFC